MEEVAMSTEPLDINGYEKNKIHFQNLYYLLDHFCDRVEFFLCDKITRSKSIRIAKRGYVI